MSLTRQQRVRLGSLLVLVCLFFVVAAARLVHLQVFKNAQYTEIVRNQSEGTVDIPAARGLVYDRNGQVVADNIVVSSLYAYPADKKELRAVGIYLEKFLKLKSGTARKKFGLAPRRFRWVKRQLDDATAEHIAETAPRGLYLRRSASRSYPFGLVGKQILGFTDVDNTGRSGLEFSFDSTLAGRQGKADIFRDGLRNTFRVKEQALVKPSPGRSVVLTADWQLQEIAEEELKAAVTEHNAASGMVVMLDCNNGDILAMAHFDPNESTPSRPTKLRAITDQFEPGSIFKVFSAAGMLDAGIIDHADSVYCEEGKWRLGRRLLRDDKKHGWMSFRQVIELSSNIGVGKYAIQLGGDELYNTARRFGIGQKMRIGLPGETRGRIVAPERWSDYTVSALAMGHAVAVNALQMAAGFAAIANGGELLRPHLILGAVNNEGYIADRRSREVIGRVATKETIDTLRAVLRGVVEVGTATPVQSDIVSIAGKTGTAEIPDLVNHCYFKNKFIASFAGFFPYEQPLVAGIVLLVEPHPVHYGGWTAGPAFRKIAERYARLNAELFTPPERILVEQSNALEATAQVPDLVGRNVNEARARTGERGLNLRCNADSGFVLWQFPAADRMIVRDDDVLVAVSSANNDSTCMVDLMGLSIREASAWLDHLGVMFTIEGRGSVVRQSIEPGAVLKDDQTCRLMCRSIQDAGGFYQTW